MQTKLTYFDDSYQFSGSSLITSVADDENGPYITLKSTIFYPQGGGQPSDTGTIDVEGTLIDVIMVRSKDGQVLHYTKQEYADVVGKKASLAIDGEKRLLHSRLHTGGHLLSLAVETLYPQWKAVKGHHFPESPYVEFTLQRDDTSIVSLEHINNEIDRMIAQKYPIEATLVSLEEFQTLCPSSTFNPNSATIRLVRIGECAYQPCGGTHVKHIGELAGQIASKQKQKGTTLRISYHIETYLI